MHVACVHQVWKADHLHYHKVQLKLFMVIIDTQYYLIQSFKLLKIWFVLFHNYYIVENPKACSFFQSWYIVIVFKLAEQSRCSLLLYHDNKFQNNTNVQGETETEATDKIIVLCIITKLLYDVSNFVNLFMNLKVYM